MSRISRGTPAGDAYLDLKNQAQRTGRTTQELLQLYVLEGFLARLAASDMRDSFVLKGGVLLAAFDTRRPTKDVDLAGINLVNSTEAVLDLVQTVLRVPVADDDGIEFFPRPLPPASYGTRSSTPACGFMPMLSWPLHG